LGNNLNESHIVPFTSWQTIVGDVLRTMLGFIDSNLLGSVVGTLLGNFIILGWKLGTSVGNLVGEQSKPHDSGQK